MEQREFLKMIRAFRRRINMAEFFQKSVFALSIGALTGILFLVAAIFVPLYYAGFYMMLALFLSELPVLVVMLVKRTTMERTALRIDGFGFEERIVTAYEHLDKEGTLIELQREDAIKQLKEHKDRIQISLCPSFKRIALLCGLLVFSLGLSLIPSKAKDRAGEIHSLKEEAREKEGEIEKIMEVLEQLEQENLTKEQQEMLTEMAESLESSLSEFRQAYSEEMLIAASQKLDYKCEIMNGQLSDIIQDLQNGAGVSIASADAVQEMTDLLKKMNGMKPGQGAGSETDQGGADGKRRQGQESGDGGGNGQAGQNGQGSQSEQNGQGGQNGQDGGSGSGNGRGTGSSSTPHDYVSVPNAIADSGNLTGNVGNHELSEYFRAQNGLNWEGEHTSYEAVIGNYEQNAYEGIAANRYPSGMEDIIKDYFASFNN